MPALRRPPPHPRSAHGDLGGNAYRRTRDALPYRTPEDYGHPPRGPASEAERLLLDALAPILDSAVELGLGHLSLDRPARTLSGGETQRLRLASQLKTGLFGVAYVLDEPTAGLHPEEREAVFTVVRTFVEQGNTVLLVEHDMNLVAQCDWIVDVGPEAGEGGGKVLFSGPVAEYLDAAIDSPTHRELTAGAKPVLNENPREPRGTVEVVVDERSFDDVHVNLGSGSSRPSPGYRVRGRRRCWRPSRSKWRTHY